MIARSALDLIGETPIVELSRIHAGPGRILAKAEFLQPGGSVKDRVARKAIELAYQDGRLRPNQPVVEMTSGNMGSALAAVCAVTGNPFIATMSEGNSPERAKMMRGLGAEVILVPQVDGSPGKVTGKDIGAAIQLAIQVAKEQNAFYVDQFNNPASIIAHEQTTGPEIWRAVGRDLSAFVAAVGSGGTFVGAARYLKSQNPTIVCAPVEPAGAEILAGRPVTKADHILQGTGYGLTPPLWQAILADLFLSVTDEEASAMRADLGQREGLYVGLSAAANVCAAKKLIETGRLGASPTVVTILCDTGLKY